VRLNAEVPDTQAAFHRHGITPTYLDFDRRRSTGSGPRSVLDGGCRERGLKPGVTSGRCAGARRPTAGTGLLVLIACRYDCTIARDFQVGSISGPATRRRFCLVLVKPSHYDDDGYVIQWLRSAIPSNSLAALYGVARDCAERGVLAPQFELEIHTFDETNSRIRPARLAALIAAAGSGMVMLVGVQSNQFPRALDLARPLRERGIQVGIGGFHVSGVLSMLNGVDADPHARADVRALLIIHDHSRLAG
jgi:hypothetical protein